MRYQPTITQSTKNGISSGETGAIYINSGGAWQQLASTGGGVSASAKVDMDEIMEEIQKRMNMVPSMEHKCHNCGGVLEMRADQHIFVCPYCGTAYAIGTVQINDRG